MEAFGWVLWDNCGADRMADIQHYCGTEDNKIVILL